MSKADTPESIVEDAKALEGGKPPAPALPPKVPVPEKVAPKEEPGGLVGQSDWKLIGKYTAGMIGSFLLAAWTAYSFPEELFWRVIYAEMQPAVIIFVGAVFGMGANKKAAMTDISLQKAEKEYEASKETLKTKFEKERQDAVVNYQAIAAQLEMLKIQNARLETKLSITVTK